MSKNNHIYSKIHIPSPIEPNKGKSDILANYKLI